MSPTSLANAYDTTSGGIDVLVTVLIWAGIIYGGYLLIKFLQKRKR